MLLTYSKERFVFDIQSGRKIHTLREDPKKRWKVGMSIQHWFGNPRNVSKHPYKFLDGECMNIEEVIIERTRRDDIRVEIAGVQLSDASIKLLAKNDGLTFREFALWFVPPKAPRWEGRIIHFTDYFYITEPPVREVMDNSQGFI